MRVGELLVLKVICLFTNFLVMSTGMAGGEREHIEGNYCPLCIS